MSLVLQAAMVECFVICDKCRARSLQPRGHPGGASIAYQDFLSGHGYLVSNLLGLPGVVLFVIWAGRYWKSVVAAGAIELLHSFPLFWFNGVYWTPHRLGGVAWGIEDILVCFSLGAGVWFFAILPVRARLAVRFKPKRFAIRLMAIAVPSTGFAILVWSLGAGVMETLLIVMTATGMALAAWRPQLLCLSAAAAGLYPAYYLMILYGTLVIVPDFFSMWDGSELWGIDVFGLPLEEIAFVLVYSAVYPLIIGTIFAAEIGGRNGNRGADRS